MCLVLGLVVDEERSKASHLVLSLKVVPSSGVKSL